MHRLFFPFFYFDNRVFFVQHSGCYHFAKGRDSAQDECASCDGFTAVYHSTACTAVSKNQYYRYVHNFCLYLITVSLPCADG